MSCLRLAATDAHLEPLGLQTSATWVVATVVNMMHSLPFYFSNIMR